MYSGKAEFPASQRRFMFCCDHFLFASDRVLHAKMPNYGRSGRGRYYGSGGYFSDLGEKWGARAGGWLGNYAGGAADKLFGTGAYYRRGYRGYRGYGRQYYRPSYRRPYGGAYYGGGRGVMVVAAPRKKKVRKTKSGNLKSEVLAPLPPTFATSKKNDYVEICHREYLGDIISSSTANTFQTQSFYINAGDVLTFPWLSQIAGACFQQFKFVSAMFEFKSMSADALNSTNTALGSVVASVNYDATDAVPLNRAMMENTDWSQCTKPSQSFVVPIECKDNETAMRGLFYTRQSQTLPTGSDRKMFDMGVLTIATLGIQGTSVNLGSLYVTYKVRLYKTVQFAPLILAGFYHLYCTGATAAALGTARTEIANNIGITASSTVLTIPRARLIPNALYMMTIVWSGTSAACTIPTITIAGGGVSMYTGLEAGATDFSATSNTGTTTGNLLYMDWFQVGSTPTSDLTITFSGGAFPTGSTTADIQIIQRNADTTSLP